MEEENEGKEVEEGVEKAETKAMEKDFDFVLPF